jgi:hypothetical protein
MRVKITVEDSSERWITLEETEARELQVILNNIFKAPTSIIVPKGTLVKESPERCANLDESGNFDPYYIKCSCNTCATKEYMDEFRSHI